MSDIQYTQRKGGEDRAKGAVGRGVRSRAEIGLSDADIDADEFTAEEKAKLAEVNEADALDLDEYGRTPEQRVKAEEYGRALVDKSLPEYAAVRNEGEASAAEAQIETDVPEGGYRAPESPMGPGYIVPGSPEAKAFSEDAIAAEKDAIAAEKALRLGESPVSEEVIPEDTLEVSPIDTLDEEGLSGGGVRPESFLARRRAEEDGLSRDGGVKPALFPLADARIRAQNQDLTPRAKDRFDAADKGMAQDARNKSTFDYTKKQSWGGAGGYNFTYVPDEDGGKIEVERPTDEWRTARGLDPARMKAQKAVVSDMGGAAWEAIMEERGRLQDSWKDKSQVLEEGDPSRGRLARRRAEETVHDTDAPARTDAPPIDDDAFSGKGPLIGYRLPNGKNIQLQGEYDPVYVSKAYTDLQSRLEREPTTEEIERRVEARVTLGAADPQEAGSSEGEAGGEVQQAAPLRDSYEGGDPTADEISQAVSELSPSVKSSRQIYALRRAKQNVQQAKTAVQQAMANLERAQQITESTGDTTAQIEAENILNREKAALEAAIKGLSQSRIHAEPTHLVGGGPVDADAVERYTSVPGQSTPWGPK